MPRVSDRHFVIFQHSNTISQYLKQEFNTHVVTTAGSPSGIAATASATAI